MPALAGPGIEEHGRAAQGAPDSQRFLRDAAAIMAAVYRHACRDAIDPAQAALGVAVGLGAACGFSEQGAGQGSRRPA